MPQADPAWPEVKSPEDLRRLLGDRFELHIPAEAVCPGHAAPFDYVAESFFSDRDLIVWSCRGGGKSMLAAVATTLEALFRPRSELVILGGSQEQSDRVAEHVRDLLEHVPHLVARESTRRKIRLKNASRIHVLAQSQTSVRGIHADRVRCDEVELFDPEVWRAVQFCTTGRAVGRGSLHVLSTAHVPGGIMEDLLARARAGTHPGRVLKWCLWEVIERCPDERPCPTCLLWEDCRGKARGGSGFFRVEDAVAIKARSSRAAWEAEVLCRGAKRELLVFAEFDLDAHSGEFEFRPEFPTYRAIDFGYSSPFVCLWVQLTPTGEVHVVDEYVQVRRSITQHAAEILRRDRGPAAATYEDPAGRARESTSGAACTELMAAAGIPCRCRHSTLAEGLELIRAALAPATGEPTLRVHRRCQLLIQAMRTYRYAQRGAGAPDAPLKDGSDHLVDALRYFFVNRARPRTQVTRKGY